MKQFQALPAAFGRRLFFNLFGDVLQIHMDAVHAGIMGGAQRFDGDFQLFLPAGTLRAQTGHLSLQAHVQKAADFDADRPPRRRSTESSPTFGSTPNTWCAK